MARNFTAKKQANTIKNNRMDFDHNKTGKIQ